MLTSVADDLWAWEENLRLPLGLRLPTRTTVVRLEGDKVLLHSPLAIDDARAKAIEEIGEPTVLVAPSCIHYMFLKKAKERWPKARVLGPAGLERKLKDFAFDALPVSGACDALGDTLRVRKIEGFPYISEHVFFHAKTRTLLSTDLVFNIHALDNFGMKFFLWLAGGWKKLSQPMEVRLFLRDRPAAAQSIADVLAWDFDRVIMGHGDVVPSGAHPGVSAALRWIGKGAVKGLLPAG